MTADNAYVGVIAGIIIGVAFVVTISMIFTNPQSLTDLNKALAPISIIIPEGASLESTSPSFKPEITRVVVGVDFVRWSNHDTVPLRLEADDDGDPAFYEATRNLIIMPGKSFEFTFTKPGEYGYHGLPWQQGRVIVLQNYQ
jgi:plastocyanin